MELEQIKNMTIKQLKEVGIRKSPKLMVCDKQFDGCKIYIEKGDLYEPEYGVGGWNFIIRKTCLNCFMRSNNVSKI